MNLKLAPETEAWLNAQVESGQFVSVEAAVDYSVKLTSLRETVLASLADTRRFTVDEVRAHLRLHFTEQRKTTAVGSK